MTDLKETLRQELLGQGRVVLHQYLTHLKTESETFIDKLAAATSLWQAYSEASVKLESRRPDLTWSTAYFLSAVNSTLVSTRLLLSGFIVPSGNQARFSIEATAFAILLAYPETGAYRDWQKKHAIEHKALERLARNSGKCDVNAKSIEALKKQAKHYYAYSHPSRLALAAIWNPSPGAGWNVGALFTEELLDGYRKEMENRVSLCKLMANAIAGTHASLIEKGTFQKNKSMVSNRMAVAE